MLFEEVLYVVCCIAYSVVNYLNACFSDFITSTWEERVEYPAIDYSEFCGFFSKKFLLPRSA